MKISDIQYDVFNQKAILPCFGNGRYPLGAGRKPADVAATENSTVRGDGSHWHQWYGEGILKGAKSDQNCGYLRKYPICLTRREWAGLGLPQTETRLEFPILFLVPENI